MNPATSAERMEPETEKATAPPEQGYFSSKLRTIGIMALATIPAVFGTASCTENSMAKHYGGTLEIKLDPGQKLDSVTWKENELWLLTREMRPEEKAENWKFEERSSFGVFEGTVVIKEQSLPQR